ncbi:MAG: hypothetical protein PT938_00450 [Solobacterium sp.]|nr:hypothetical protein [Solobacterium sp.]MDY2952741.1 hypothetical protein [Erysipelotrichaceae bacterium]
MMENNDNRAETLKRLRKTIYFYECNNLHKKMPEKDSVMVDKIIHLIKCEVDKENTK